VFNNCNAINSIYYILNFNLDFYINYLTTLKASFTITPENPPLSPRTLFNISSSYLNNENLLKSSENLESSIALTYNNFNYNKPKSLSISSSDLNENLDMDLDTNNSNKSSNYGSSINNEDITEIEVKLDNVIIKELKIEQN